MAVALSLFIMLSSVGAALGQPVLERLVAAHEGVTDVHARFVQTTTLEAAQIDRVSGGTVIFKRGGKMRWSYEGDDPQLLVSDGEVLWIYQERDRTALRRAVATLSPAGRLAMDILDGAREMETHFLVDSCGENCAELIAKEPGADVDRLRLEVSPKDAMLTRITTTDQVGNVTRIEFSEIRVNAGANDDLFIFDPPEGVDLFDAEGNPL
jgi:outer membrane lipoprotein carrier protein